MIDSKSKVVVTGAGGFLGRAVTSALKASGHRPIGLSRRTFDYSTTSLEQTFRGVDAVIHLAATRGGAESITEFLDDVALTERIAESAGKAGVRSMILTSSISVYDPTVALPWFESNCGIPRNTYGISKLASENVALNAARRSGVRTVVLRLGHLYGAHEDNDHMINVFFRNAGAGQRLRVCPPSERRRDLTLVDDAAAGVIAALISPSAKGIYNIGGGDFVSNYEIATSISEAFELPMPEIVPEWDDLGSITSKLDITRARQELCWTPLHDFRSGVLAVREALGTILSPPSF